MGWYEDITHVSLQPDDLDILGGRSEKLWPMGGGVASDSG